MNLRIFLSGISRRLGGFPAPSEWHWAGFPESLLHWVISIYLSNYKFTLFAPILFVRLKLISCILWCLSWEVQNKHKTQKTNSYKKNTRHFHEVKLMETQVLVPAEKAIVCTTKALQAPKVIIISWRQIKTKQELHYS